MRRAQGSITRHGDGWRVFATIHDTEGNTRKASKVVHGNRKQAEKALSLLLAQDYQTPSKPFESVCLMYLQEMEKRAANGSLEPRTVKEYRAHIQTRIIPALGSIATDELNPIHLRRFLNSLEKNQHAIYKTLRQLLNWSERNAIIESNPIGKIEAPKAGRLATREDVYTTEEVRQILGLLENEPAWFQVATSIALGCGLRRGEICGLDWSDYDGQRINVNKAFGKERPKTPNSVRLVSVPSWTAKILNEFKGFGAMVAIDGERVHPDSLTHHWQRFTRANDLRPLPFKNLRHTSLTLAYESTIGENGEGNLYLVSLRAGHSNVGITAKYYARPSQNADDRLAEAMGKMC